MTRIEQEPDPPCESSQDGLLCVHFENAHLLNYVLRIPYCVRAGETATFQMRNP